MPFTWTWSTSAPTPLTRRCTVGHLVTSGTAGVEVWALASAPGGWTSPLQADVARQQWVPMAGSLLLLGNDLRFMMMMIYRQF